MTITQVSIKVSSSLNFEFELSEPRRSDLPSVTHSKPARGPGSQNADLEKLSRGAGLPRGGAEPGGDATVHSRESGEVALDITDDIIRTLASH